MWKIAFDMDKNIQELEIQACKTFVCPNIGTIETKGKILDLREGTIERAKNMAIEYFRKTYHKPSYSSVKYVLPAFVYIAAILEDDRRSQTQISYAFSVTKATIKKWYREVLNTLDIELPLFEEKDLVTIDLIMDEIDKNGKALSLKHSTIKKAKTLILEYFDTDLDAKGVDRYFPYSMPLLSGIIYTASLIENDRVTQYDVFEISGVCEGIISRWHRNVLRKLDMKVISHRGRVIGILKGNNEN